MNGDLTCKAGVKRYALERAADTRDHKFTRVSDELCQAAEAAARRAVDQIIATHPSVGRTIKP